jgi:hypothetical protein
MENPALAGTGLPKNDLCFAGWINSEDTNSTRLIQVSSLTRRCAISAVMAAVIAPILFGEGGR